MLEKSKAITSKRNVIYIKLIIINLLVMIVFNLVFYPRFQNRADIVMQVLVYGVGYAGANVSHILFSNVILGKAYDILMSITPNFPWYIVIHYIFCFIAIYVISLITIKRNHNKTGWIITTVILAFFGYECYITPGYLKTATVLCVAAIYLSVYLIENRILNVRNVYLPIILGLISSLFSFYTFAYIFAMGVFFTIIYLLITKGIKQYCKNFILVFASIAVLAVGLFFVDSFNYREDAVWSQYSNYRTAIEQLYSYGVVGYDEDLAIDLGIESKKEFNRIVNLHSNHPYDDTFEKAFWISTYKKDISFDTLDRFFKSVPIKLFTVGMFYCWLILTTILCLYTKHKKRYVIGVSLFGLLLALLVFYRMEAISNLWIYAICIMPTVMFLLLLIKDIKCDDNKSLAIFIGVLSIILYSRFSGSFVTTINDEDMMYTFNDSNVQYRVNLERYLPQFSVYKTYPKDMFLADNMHCQNVIFQYIPEFANAYDFDKIKKKDDKVNVPDISW